MLDARLPRHLPTLSQLLDDLGNPPAHAVADHLGVCRRTVGRWASVDDAPRSSRLALYWSSTWGRSAAECAAYNDASQAVALAEALKRENAALKRELSRVAALADSGAANAPSLMALTPVELLRRRVV